MDKTPFKVLKNTRSVRTGTVWLEPRVIHVSSAGHHVTLTLKKNIILLITLHGGSINYSLQM